MKKFNRINVWKEYPNENSVSAYLNKTIDLYQDGDYESALEGFERLSTFDNVLKNMLIPHIEKCKHIVRKKLSIIDRQHMKHQEVLKHFGWLDMLKYFTGLVSFVFFTLLISDPEEGTTFSKNLSRNPSFLVWSIILAIITFLLHKFMEEFTVSRGLIRCKYCGKYTRYIDPNKPFIARNNCDKCHRTYPVPNFYWDGWEGLDYMENRLSVPDKEFYKEFNQLKMRFPEAYSKAIKSREN